MIIALCSTLVASAGGVFAWRWRADLHDQRDRNRAALTSCAGAIGAEEMRDDHALNDGVMWRLPTAQDAPEVTMHLHGDFLRALTLRAHTHALPAPFRSLKLYSGIKTWKTHAELRSGERFSAPLKALLLALYPAQREAIDLLFQRPMTYDPFVLEGMEFDPEVLVCAYVIPPDAPHHTPERFLSSLEELTSSITAIATAMHDPDDPWYLRLAQADQRTIPDELLAAASNERFNDPNTDIDAFWDELFGEDGAPTKIDLKHGWMHDWREMLEAPMALAYHRRLMQLVLTNPARPGAARVLKSRRLELSDKLSALDTLVAAQGLKPLWPYLLEWYETLEEPEARGDLLDSVLTSSALFAARLITAAPDRALPPREVREIATQLLFRYDETIAREDPVFAQTILLGLFDHPDADEHTRAAILSTLAEQGTAEVVKPLRERVHERPDAAWAKPMREAIFRLTERFPHTFDERIGQLTLSEDDTTRGGLSVTADKGGVSVADEPS